MLRHISALCLFALLTGSVFAQTAKVVEVAAGDLAALTQAIQDANERPSDQETVILTRGLFSFASNQLLPRIKGTVAIIGHTKPAIFQSRGEGPKQLFFIETGASLRLVNIELTDFSLAQNGGGLIENEGNLFLKEVQLSSVKGERVCIRACTSGMSAISNRLSGYLHLDKVSIVDSGIIQMGGVFYGGILFNEGSAVLENVQIYVIDAPWSNPLSNLGTLVVHNSSFLFAKHGQFSSISLLSVSDDANTEFVNSVIAGFSGEWCQEATSIGHNLIDAAGCNWSAEGDLVGVPAGLIWRPVDANWGNGDSRQQILTHALVPSAASAAVDSADADLCTSFDLLGNRRNINDGNGDGVNGCDRGAVELLPIGLAEGGINGLYFNPEADGHFIYILQTDFTTLVVWTTFDADGNPAWVFGTGELINGRSVIADTYINRNGGRSPDGEITASEAEHWGRMEVDMTSCLEGTFTFQSDLPEFGSGQFPIKRLAFVKQLGCIGSD